MTEPLLSPLHERHVALGARFAEFAGWSMPLQYAGVVAEHKAVRTGVGIFDVSHLGNARVSGPGARAFVNACLTNDLGRIAPGQAQYTLCCDEAGGVVDDLIAYLVSDDEVMLIPNAANTAEVVRRLAEAAPAGVIVANEHTDYAIVAVQGPSSDAVLGALGIAADFDYMQFRPAVLDGRALTVCRTGYTGERGYELVCRAEDAPAVWDAVMAAGQAHGIAPCGLGARDTLRTEMGYALHGHELSLDIDPVTAGVGWAVGWDKPSFWGADALRALRAQGTPLRSRAIKAADRAIPRPGMECVDDAGAVIGRVTSGTFSPTLEAGIGLALLPPDYTPGGTVGVRVRRSVETFSVEKAPLVTGSVR
ncbi:MAG: glycine cleavage system aminomethyltransferase GcvT [Propioniciclava sp.]|uniref:glycine cleavage system aminomethyltransferase GcvT n=1 Tax=Propioniciclava sp. TaxID=2038686 RepID=UPI0039E61313